MACAPFEQHVLTGLERLVHEVDGVGDIRLEVRRDVVEVLADDRVALERELVVDLRQHAVLLLEHDVELLSEDLGVEEVLHTEADPRRLVRIGGTDAPLGRAELVLAEVPLGDPVERLVVREDQVGVGRRP